jgi:PAS domain S-box-containing protein
MKGNWLLQKGIFRFLILNLLIAIAYAIGVSLSHKFATLPGAVTSVWFPSGMTLALVFFLGKRVFLGIAIGSFLGNSPFLLNYKPELSLFNIILINFACACGDIFQPWLATYFIKKFARHKDIFSHIDTVVLYIVAAFFSPTVSASFGVTSLYFAELIKWNEYEISWLTWWLHSALAHLIFTPTLLLYKESRYKCREYKLWEDVIIIFILLLVSWFVFVKSYPLEYLFLPILIGIVFRFGRFVSSLSVSLISLVAIVSTSLGHGIFVAASAHQSLILLQSFTSVLAVTSLILSAVVDERAEAKELLKQAVENLEYTVNQRTEELIDSKAQLSGFFTSAPVGMGIVDHQLRYIQVNQVLADMNYRSIDEHLGKTLQEVVPEISAMAEGLYRQVLQTGKILLNQEISSVTRDKSAGIKTWLTSFFPIFNVDNIPYCVGFVVIEISDRKKAEADMQYA